MLRARHATVVGVFEDQDRAERAIRDLQAAGFGDDRIGVARRQDDGEDPGAGRPGGETRADSGALAGALTGAGLGTLAGLGILTGAIPIVGPAIVGGTLGVLLSNAAAGAGVAGLAGALIGAGLPEGEAASYERELQAGRTLVTVRADSRADEARAILQRHGAYDLSRRGAGAAPSG
jgi:hypothetical protein